MTREQFSRDDSPYDICNVCGEQAWDYPRCRECGTVDYAWLQDQVRPVRMTWDISADGQSGRIAA